MPCLEIAIPKLDLNIKQKLVAKLTSEFARITDYPAEIFGIRFEEYSTGEAASGGKMITDSDDRPYIHFLLYCPRLKRTIKQSLVEAFTTVCQSVTGKATWWPVIHICEHPYDNVGVEGKLLSDAYEACGKAGYYYELPKD